VRTTGPRLRGTRVHNRPPAPCHAARRCQCALTPRRHIEVNAGPAAVGKAPSRLSAVGHWWSWIHVGAASCHLALVPTSPPSPPSAPFPRLALSYDSRNLASHNTGDASPPTSVTFALPWPLFCSDLDIDLDFSRALGVQRWQASAHCSCLRRKIRKHDR
jgi:hypothetical protein